MDNLFEQIANISKAGAYDILVEQVGELKKENAKLREALQGLINIAQLTTKDIIAFEGASTLDAAIDFGNKALKVTKFS
jgi:hypothetical protein